MRAVILAGGRGRRLGPFTAVFPKPLAPIGELPIIDILVRQLAHHGFRSLDVSIGYLGELVEAYFLTRGLPAGVSVRYLRETEPLGTAGPVRQGYRDGEAALVINGDVLTSMDFRAFAAWFAERRPALAIGVMRRSTQVEFGVVDTDAGGRVLGFREKPVMEHRCSIGVNILGPAAIAAIGDGERLDLPDLVERLLARGEPVLTYEVAGYWQDIGRRDDYDRAVEEFPAMRATLLPDEAVEDDPRATR